LGSCIFACYLALMRLKIGMLAVGLASLGLSGAASAKSTRKPVEGLMLRLDLGAVGSWNHHETSFSEAGTGYSFDSKAFSLGPKLALNLGFAPIRLVRIGVFGAAEAAPYLGGDSFPGTELGAQFRITFGPTVGFRFGPSVPLELEVALAVAHLNQTGSHDDSGNPENGYPLMSDQWGGQGGLKLLFRPGGAGDPFALYAGLLGGLTGTGANGTDTKASLMAAELGISIGL
jgi:hypothetical protein